MVDKDKEQQYSQVMVMFKHDAMPKEVKGDKMYMVIDFAKSMMSSMLNERLSEKAQAQAYDGN